MTVRIDFKKKEIHFDEVSIHEMAFCMSIYFPEETWGDFKFMIDAGVNEESDSDGELFIPFGTG